MKRTVTIDSNVPRNKRTKLNPKHYKKSFRSHIGFNERVRKAVQRITETKRKSKVLNEQTITTIAADPALISFPMDPQVGAGAYQRIGNQVRMVGLRCKVILHNNSSAIPMYIRCAILRVKNGSSTANSTVLSDLFDPLEGGGDVTYPGGLGSLIRRFNSEQLEVIKDTQIDLENQVGHTKIFSFYKRFDEPIVYSDLDQAEPFNTRFVLLLLPLRADSDESLGQTLEYSLVQDFYYKDNN